MPYIFCYTKAGEGIYPDFNYPGHVGYMCDWEHAMHLAVGEDQETFVPLRNNTGILFPKCTFTEGDPKGTTKTLIDPWIFRKEDGTFMVSAIRRNRNAADPLSVGCMMLFSSKDLVRYEECGFMKLSDEEIRHPRVMWEKEAGSYYVEWEQGEKTCCGRTVDLSGIEQVQTCDQKLKRSSDHGIEGCVPGNVIEVSEEEAAVIRGYLGEIRHVANEPMSLSIACGNSLETAQLPKAVCVYSDGSTHEKPVDWDEEALRKIDTTNPGEYTVKGTIRAKKYPFPIASYSMSDPCIKKINEKYYLTSSGGQQVIVRCADTVEGVFSAPPQVMIDVPLGEFKAIGTWAAELHVIDGVIYLLTSICPNGEWTRVQSVVFRCNGDPLDQSAWEGPYYCVKPDGNRLTEGGISLDMTYFRDNGIDYVMWSDRKIRYEEDPVIPEPADIYIATIDPKEPWKTTSEPRCVIRPMYGWDRMETEVDEGPYLLRRGDDLFVTISGSSTGMSDLYDLGLLRAKTGTDLLNADNWDWLPYPVLTKESAPGEYGPGHNSFIKDPETGDDLLIYHAVPHDENDKTLLRKPAVRRVHWAKTGLPYLEMTGDRDLSEDLKEVELTISIEEK